MSLLIQCWYCTEENGKFKYAKECVESLFDTVDLSKHRLVIINQNCCSEAKEYLVTISQKQGVTIVNLSENIGTARGINIGLMMREPNEICVKSDEDLSWETQGWLDELTETIKNNTDIGILGLKRDDVWQRPDHENPLYRTKMEGELEICDDIFGTCTAFNPLLLDKIGFMCQPSLYSYDDVIFSVRSLAAGFRNAFLPKIKITNLDKGGTEYTEWKKREAGVHIDQVAEMCRMYKEGKLNYYYDGGL